jgi:hypothetical protein
LWLWRQSGVHIEEPIPHEPAYGGDKGHYDEHPNSVSIGRGNSNQISYRVVAFMVKVKLVENSVKRIDGIVMVVKVISQ